MSGHPPVIHLTFGEGLSSVFIAQVARPMAHLKDLGYDPEMVVFAPLGHFLRSTARQAWRQQKEEVETSSGLSLVSLPAPPSRLASLWDCARPLRWWLTKRFGKGHRVVLHCRGTAATHVAINATENNNMASVISDCRGLDAEEFLLFQNVPHLREAPRNVAAAYQELFDRQGRALMQSDAVICVSNAMKNYVVDTWSIPTEKISVLPCCTDFEPGLQAVAQRDAMRSRLNFGRRFVVAYCGSLLPWQMFGENLAVFREIKKLRPNSHFLGLTNNPGRMAEALRSAGIDENSATIISAAHRDVPNYLAAADLGLLIRRNSVVNRVASPVKFAEYLSCAVPVLMTDQIGDYSSLVKSKGVGCVLCSGAADEGSLSTLSAFLTKYQYTSDQLRSNCTAVARDLLNWSSGVRKLSRLISRLSGPPLRSELSDP